MNEAQASKRAEELMLEDGVDKASAEFDPATGKYRVAVQRSNPDGSVSGDSIYVGEK